MTFARASTDDVDPVIDEESRGMWFLRDELGTGEVGLTVVELREEGRAKRPVGWYDELDVAIPLGRGDASTDAATP